MIDWGIFEAVAGAKAVSVITLILGIFLGGCAGNQPKDELPLSVEIGEPVHYRSETGEQFVARYGGLSDGSLHFVKLEMPNGQEYTLPQVVSGSGVRYTDDREIVWWTHQGSVRVDVRDDEGKWITRYTDLREVHKSN